MNKMVIPVIVGLLFALNACGVNYNAESISTVQNDKESSEATKTDFEYKNSSATDETQATPLNENNICSFTSVEEMLATLESNQSLPYMVEVNDEETSSLKVIVEQGITWIPVPKYEHVDLPLQNVNGLDNILVEPNSVFGIPIIWYYSELDGADVIISTGILTDEEIKQLGDGSIDALKKWKEDILATLPENPDAIEVSTTTTQSDILINDARLPAIITQYSTDPRYHVEFIADDSIYVKIYIYPEDYDCGVLSELSFIKETITNP